MIRITLYRAANDDIITDCAAFATRRDDAEAYLANPGFGGATLYRADAQVEPRQLLDLYELTTDAALDELCRVTGLEHPGAMTADVWVPRIAEQLAAAGYEWVRVRDTFPRDCETWIAVGGDALWLDMEPCR